MRIIAGKWRGVPIAAPDGMGTRPTIDRARESLMSSLTSALCGFDGVVALDAFAGSGALGLEVLSRGAQCVWFYENNANAALTLQKNIQKLKADAQSYVINKQDVFKCANECGHKPFHLVMLDPPYAYAPDLVFEFLDKLCACGALAKDVVVSYEHSTDVNIDVYFENQKSRWTQRAHKVFGPTTIDIFERQEND